MDICGNICVDKSGDEFILKCSHCTKEVEIFLWHQFVHHFQSLHKPVIEFCVDPLTDVDNDAMQLATDISDCEETGDDNNYSPKTTQNSSDSEEDVVSESEVIPVDADEKPEPIKKFKPSFYRRNPCTDIFILSYQKLPCLWDANNVDYNNMEERSKAYQTLIDDMKSHCNIMLTERTANAAIKRLHAQYNSVYEAKKDCVQKMPSIKLEYLEKCSFLNNVVAIKENYSDDEDDKSKILELTKENDVTNAFITAYESVPQLYDTNHSDYANPNARIQAYDELKESLKAENIIWTDDEIYSAIKELRLWYSKTCDKCKTGLNELSVGHQYYMEKCSFLPQKFGQLKLPCEHCGKHFLSDMSLQVHLFKDHNIGELPFKCKQCERCFEQKSHLRIHQQRKHIEKIYKCEFCERPFAVYAALKLHVTTHSGQKPYVCEQCGKAFRLKYQLGYHINAIHTKNRAFKCTMCPKDFLKNRDLKDHIKAHLNIRDKICETCGKGFTNCHSLIRHRQIHADVKKFSCKLCDAKFFQFVGLNTHMKRTHNIVKNKPKE